METSNTWVDSTISSFATSGIQDDLVHNFLLFFARFEYAMKRAGFLKGDEKKAEADWDKLAVDLRATFGTSTSVKFNEAVEYLCKHPPKKQIVIEGKLDWAAARQDQSESKSQYVLRLVRSVRNNLFHGGKFPEPTGPIAESARDRELLKHSLSVLTGCVGLEPRLQPWFKVD